MMTVLMLIVFLMTYGLTLWYIDGGIAKAAYLKGKRDGLGEAIEIAKERGDVAVLCSPKGSLTEGLLRAQAVHTVELDLRAALSGVR